MSQHSSPFNAIRQQAEDSSEYWSARQLYKLLGYSRWEKFHHALKQAKIACEKSGQAASDHFHLQVKMVTIGSGATRKTEDYHLSLFMFPHFDNPLVRFPGIHIDICQGVAHCDASNFVAVAFKHAAPAFVACDF